MIKQACGSAGYTSLEGNMLNIEITTKVEDITVVTYISYNEELQYPLMYIKE